MAAFFLLPRQQKMGIGAVWFSISGNDRIHFWGD